MVRDFSLCGITEFLNTLLTGMSVFSKLISNFRSQSLKLVYEIIQIKAKSRAARDNDSPTYSATSSEF